MSNDDIEVHELFGFMVFTGSEGEDPRPAAWFPDELSAEAFVRAGFCPPTATGTPERQVIEGKNLSIPPEAFFEPSITPSLGMFASSYGKPALPVELTKALSNHCDNDEAKDLKALLREALPYVEGIEGYPKSDRLIARIKEALK